MEQQLLLSERALEFIKDNGVVYGRIADALNISPMSLVNLIYNNSAKLTQASVIRILEKEMGVQVNEILCELQEIN